MICTDRVTLSRYAKTHNGCRSPTNKIGPTAAMTGFRKRIKTGAVVKEIILLTHARPRGGGFEGTPLFEKINFNRKTFSETIPEIPG